MSEPKLVISDISGGITANPNGLSLFSINLHNDFKYTTPDWLVTTFGVDSVWYNASYGNFLDDQPLTMDEILARNLSYLGIVPEYFGLNRSECAIELLGYIRLGVDEPYLFNSMEDGPSFGTAKLVWQPNIENIPSHPQFFKGKKSAKVFRFSKDKPWDCVTRPLYENWRREPPWLLSYWPILFLCPCPHPHKSCSRVLDSIFGTSNSNIQQKLHVSLKSKNTIWHSYSNVEVLIPAETNIHESEPIVNVGELIIGPGASTSDGSNVTVPQLITSLRGDSSSTTSSSSSSSYHTSNPSFHVDNEIVIRSNNTTADVRETAGSNHTRPTTSTVDTDYANSDNKWDDIAVCSVVPYTSSDPDKVAGNQAMLREWLHYYSQLGLHVLLYDRDGANIDILSPIGHDVALGGLQKRISYHNFTVRGLFENKAKILMRNALDKNSTAGTEICRYIDGWIDRWLDRYFS